MAQAAPTIELFTMGLCLDADGNIWRYQGANGMVLIGSINPAPVPPSNTVPPNASGTNFTQGGLAVTSNRTWIGDSPRVYTYQWQVTGGAAIAGATTQSWTIEGHEGDMIECVVTATNDGGSASATSNSIGPIEA